MTLESEFLHHVQACLNREIGVEQLEGWYVPRTSEIVVREGTLAHDLAGEFDLARHEWRCGHETEEGVRARLARFLASRVYWRVDLAASGASNLLADQPAHIAAGVFRIS